VLTTPVIRCLKQQIENIEIHYLTKSQFKNIVSTNIYIDKVHTLDTSLANTITLLRQENYDGVIDLHNNLRTQRVKLALNKPSHSFKKLNFKKWLLVKFKTNHLPAIHIVDRYMETVAHLGVKNDGQGLDYFITNLEKTLPPTLPAIYAKGHIAFAIGGQHSTKKLPNAKIVEILQGLNYPVILLGGKEDAENGEAIVKALPQANIINRCGVFSLNQSALAVKNSKCLITHDTGMMHIGAALNIPILSVWGNTVPQFGMMPYYKHDSKAALQAEIFEVLDLKCRPCSKIGYDKCPQGHFDCMVKQDSKALSKKALLIAGAK